jgi:hypothetical protein
MASFFINEEQEYDNWCWAAVSANVYRYFHPEAPKRQCEIAKEFLTLQQVANADECCSENLPTALNQVEKVQDTLKSIRVLKKIAEPLQFEDLQKQIDASLPVCARIQWPEQGRAHVVVIIGYGVTASGEEWVDIADPFAGYLCVPYEWFRDCYLDLGGEWTHSFLLKKPA